jgi:hypothetical protein
MNANVSNTLGAAACAIYYIYYIFGATKNHANMKKILFLLMLPAVISLVNCTGSKEADETAKIPGMMEVDLTSHGFPLTVMIPDSTKGRAEITEQSWGAVEIKVGKSFQISIAEGEGDVALAKSDVASNEVNKFKRYIKDEPTLLFYESEITQPEFHFYSVVKTGKTSYVVEDIKGEVFNEKDVERMIESAQSLKAKEAQPAS